MTLLAGTTVLDLSLQLPGPYATMLLAGLGARVIKIEPPAGDPARAIDPPMFERVNAGKEFLTLDLKSAAGRQVLHRLVGTADALIEGFRPGVVARLQVDEPRLRPLNPRLVYCSLSGFGQAGPYAQVPGHDLNYLAIAGGIDVSPCAGQGVGVPMVDLAAGTTAALLIVAAFAQAARTGRGEYLDMALLDAAVVWSHLKRPQPGGQDPTYGVFATADGGRVAVAVLEDPMWRRLCRALGWADWFDDPDLAGYQQRRRRATPIAERLRTTLASRTAGEWLALAATHDLPLTAAQPLAHAVVDPQVDGRALFQGGFLQAPFPAAVRSVLQRPAQAPGADTRAILGAAGWSDDEIACASDAGAFGEPRATTAGVR